MSESRRSGQFIIPGEKLGVIEEFIPDSGTYVEDGVIRSQNTGYMLMDFANKKVSVYPVVQNLKVPTVGSTVSGRVTGAQSSQAIIRIEKVKEKSISGYLSGLIYISDVSFKYTENMLDAFRVGDIIRAKVISDKNATYHLTTKGENLGVVFAHCSRCGEILTRSRGALKCVSCDHIERRKTAADFGTGDMGTGEKD